MLNKEKISFLFSLNFNLRSNLHFALYSLIDFDAQVYEGEYCIGNGQISERKRTHKILMKNQAEDQAFFSVYLDRN